MSHFNIFKILKEERHPLPEVPMGIKTNVGYVIEMDPDEYRRTVVDDCGAFRGTVHIDCIVMELSDI